MTTAFCISLSLILINRHNYINPQDSLHSTNELLAKAKRAIVLADAKGLVDCCKCSNTKEENLAMEMSRCAISMYRFSIYYRYTYGVNYINMDKNITLCDREYIDKLSSVVRAMIAAKIGMVNKDGINSCIVSHNGLSYFEYFIYDFSRLKVANTDILMYDTMLTHARHTRMLYESGTVMMMDGEKKVTVDSHVRQTHGPGK